MNCVRCDEPSVLFGVCLECASWNSAAERLAQANCGAAFELGRVEAARESARLTIEQISNAVVRMELAADAALSGCATTWARWEEALKCG